MDEENNENQISKYMKKTIKKWAIRILIPVVAVGALILFTFASLDAVGDRLQELTNAVKDFFEVDLREGEYQGKIELKPGQVDQIIDAMDKIGVDLDDLQLMGDDVDYNDPKIKKLNREALRKYVKKFYEAQAITETIYLKEGFLKELFKNIKELLNTEDAYGTVYLYRINGDDDNGQEPISKDNLRNRNMLKYKEYEKFKEMAEEAKRMGNIDTIRKHYSIEPETGKLVIPYWTIVKVNDKLESITVSLKHIDYKKNLAQYTTSMNFFFYLASVSRNPEFVSAVADLVKTGEIYLVVLENKNQTIEEEEYYETRNTMYGPRKVWGPYGERLEDIPARGPYKHQMPVKKTKIDTVSVTAQLKIVYVKTWFCEQSISYRKENVGPNISNYTYDAGNDESLKDDTPPGILGYDQMAIWYTNKRKEVKITRQGYKYKEETRSKVEDRTGEKGDPGVYDENNNGKVDNGERINEESRFLGLIDDYFNIPNTSRYESAGVTNLVTGAEWFFYLLDKDPTLQNLQQLMRYVMYKYTGKDYGVKEFDFQVYDAKDFTSISVGGSKLLKQYIHMWENASGAPKSADGKYYIVHDDGYGHPTVGYGVDILNGGYANEIIAAGYSIEIGAQIPVEFVDALEEREIESKLEQVEAYVNGLDLTPYQINALVSRAYNCGVTGAITTLRGSPSMNFVDSYNSYWNKETDDYFKQQNPNANFAHKLYTQYMSKPVTSENQYSLGLERRRKSEWTLFQTGYYDVLNAWHAGGGDLVAACEELTRELISRGARYSLDYGLISGDIERCCEEATHLCCATYVAMALHNSGLLSAEQINAYNYHWTGSGGIPSMLAAAGWTQVDPSEAQPGDIVNHNTVHVLVYAGNGQCWDQTSAVYSSRGWPPSGTTTTYDLNKCEIWRAP